MPGVAFPPNNRSGNAIRNPPDPAALDGHARNNLMTPRWPSSLWVVRHGQSAGNVARDAADAAGAERIELDHRDVDVPLSRLGKEQSRALGEWFAAGKEDGRPEILLASPYVRAVQTAEIFRHAGGCASDVAICIDERLREKEFGILDGLTRFGIEAAHPDQAEYRSLLGKFYHRPPGGESWCDVILRLRSLLDTVSLHYGGRRVMIVAHQVVVLCLRTIIENLGEAEILAIDKEGDVANCAITEYRFHPQPGGDGHLALARYNVTAPMQDEVPVTREPDAMVAARG
ncbi:histidine phosphatase family protein [Sphingopyxis sp. UBA6734]|jgi:broad specificity phosphatase PhoE|uniref:histidine phosphatase family protein n=2 Tax=unclassified Sphingopyxis TaxID=2614943 RepID=UPI0032E474C0